MLNVSPPRSGDRVPTASDAAGAGRMYPNDRLVRGCAPGGPPRMAQVRPEEEERQVKLGAVFSSLDLGTDFGVIRDVVQGLDDAGFDFFSTNDHVVGGHPERAQGQRVHT